MAKKHDEAQDVNILKRKMRVDTSRKVIECSKSTIVGNKSWGRIDYLTHYCGYVFIWNNEIKLSKDNYSSDSNKKEELRKAKKEAKQHTLTNKNSKRKSA